MSESPRDPGQRAGRPEKPREGKAQPPAPAESGSARRLSSQQNARNEGPGQRPSSSEPVIPRRKFAEPVAVAAPATDATVFVPSGRAPETRRRRWPLYTSIFLFLAAVVAVGIMVNWPRLKPRPLDAVERVAADYLKALSADDSPTIKRLGTVEEPPAIRSYRSMTHNPKSDQRMKGSFAPLGQLHSRIDAEFVYDSSSGRFTPKNALGAAAETLDKLHAAKEDAEKSGLYKKMQSGDPEELFDAAEQFGKVFTQLAEGALAPKKILPTYKMLVDESKPPIPDDAKALALEVAGATKEWDALLKRSFHTLKADGPFVYERAQVNATATDRLASSGDPPSRLRLDLVRFRLEGIDSGWKVISIKRVLPGQAGKPVEPSPSSTPRPPAPSPGEQRSLHDVSDVPGKN
jgi:hypothetical protein